MIIGKYPRRRCFTQPNSYYFFQHLWPYLVYYVFYFDLKKLNLRRVNEFTYPPPSIKKEKPTWRQVENQIDIAFSRNNATLECGFK